MNYFSEKDEEIILGNIDDTLSGDEKAYFQQRYQSDIEFKKHADAYQDALDAVLLSGKEQIKSVLRDEAEKYRAETLTLPVNKKTARIFPLWGMRAAAAAVFIGISIFTYLSLHTGNNETLFAENFKPMEDMVLVSFKSDDAQKINAAFRTRHSPAEVILAQKALNAYDAKRYAESIALFNQLTEKDDTLALSKASAFLALDQVDSAKNIFAGLQTSNTGLIKSAANWYLALIDLKENKINDAKTTLQKLIQQPESAYRAEARELLDQIERKK